MKDHEITQLFLERSEQAIPSLILEYGAAIRQVSAGILRDPQDVEECVNDTYLEVWNRVPPQRPRSLGAFACRIARNISLNRYHYNSAGKRDGRYDTALDELAAAIPSGSTVESEYDARELAQCVNRFLAVLSEGDRYLFMQRYWLGASVSHIARDTGLSPRSVSVRLFRVRARLNKYLRKEGIME